MYLAVVVLDTFCLNTVNIYIKIVVVLVFKQLQIIKQKAGGNVLFSHLYVCL